MKLNKKDMLLYVVTDRSWLGQNSLSEQLEQIIKAGATFIQLREKNLPFEEFVKLAQEIKLVTDRYKVPFVINDSVEVALTVNADGVHIGQGDEGIKIARARLGFNKIIGLSAHTVDEAIKAQEDGADYIGVGAVFNTTTKLDANTVPFETLKEICRRVQIPVVAIGGITRDNIIELKGSGVDGIAVVSAIFAQPDVAGTTRELLRLAGKI